MLGFETGEPIAKTDDGFQVTITKLQEFPLQKPHRERDRSNDRLKTINN